MNNMHTNPEDLDEQNKQKRETASVEIDLSAYLKAVEDSRNE